MNLEALDDDDLLALLNAVGAERERRANLAHIPEQIASLAQTYRDGGGDEQTLADALTPERLDT